jgi:1,4-alpha-glucan branching enzyme
MKTFLSPKDNWQWLSHPFKKLEYGKWELMIPAREDGSCLIQHLSEIKVIIRTKDGKLVDRLSPWAKYVVQPPKEANQGVNFKQRVWHPPAHEVSKSIIPLKLMDLINYFLIFTEIHVPPSKTEQTQVPAHL